VVEHHHPRDAIGDVPGHGEAAVLGAVVDDDELDVQAVVCDREDLLDARVESLFFVVARDDDAERHPRELRCRRLLERPVAPVGEVRGGECFRGRNRRVLWLWKKGRG
jgi:hypothetical protein